MRLSVPAICSGLRPARRLSTTISHKGVPGTSRRGSRGSAAFATAAAAPYPSDTHEGVEVVPPAQGDSVLNASIRCAAARG